MAKMATVARKETPFIIFEEVISIFYGILFLVEGGMRNIAILKFLFIERNGRSGLYFCKNMLIVQPCHIFLFN